ncbi:winged helix-turn-helix transcriptional regulator [Amycolatopsis acidicola]|uniref:Winged helix-turn-helix transcriptional regulator n=1 Tax=Amycolatopsis acidicola TaxID=2596893 RepID=A0A5N0UTI0_9PSEU|nr:winged helix-turn-helix domain-containing protein [Amycolatopsis acidicola]KAA9155529.1 winged helix-turn-helix transcriptional regulator [Amycolatopsis acidicola]
MNWFVSADGHCHPLDDGPAVPWWWPTNEEYDVIDRSKALNRDIPGYVHEQLAHDITVRIAEGDLRPRTPLPSERRVCVEYGVAIGTARQAVKNLADAGLLQTFPSKGTYVTVKGPELAKKLLAEQGAEEEPEPVSDLFPRINRPGAARGLGA